LSYYNERSIIFTVWNHSSTEIRHILLIITPRDKDIYHSNPNSLSQDASSQLVEISAVRSTLNLSKPEEGSLLPGYIRLDSLAPFSKTSGVFWLYMKRVAEAGSEINLSAYCIIDESSQLPESTENQGEVSRSESPSATPDLNVDLVEESSPESPSVTPAAYDAEGDGSRSESPSATPDLNVDLVEESSPESPSATPTAYEAEGDGSRSEDPSKTPNPYQFSIKFNSFIAMQHSLQEAALLPPWSNIILVVLALVVVKLVEHILPTHENLPKTGQRERALWIIARIFGFFVLASAWTYLIFSVVGFFTSVSFGSNGETLTENDAVIIAWAKEYKFAILSVLFILGDAIIQFYLLIFQNVNHESRNGNGGATPSAGIVEPIRPDTPPDLPPHDRSSDKTITQIPPARPEPPYYGLPASKKGSTGGGVTPPPKKRAPSKKQNTKPATPTVPDPLPRQPVGLTPDKPQPAAEEHPDTGSLEHPEATPPTQPDSEKAILICPVCKTHNDPGAGYCTNCGHQFIQSK
jgi:hypothetical protein